MDQPTLPAIMRKTVLRKSRSGCETCRARKVKCDEIRPVCGNCRRRFMHIEQCDYKPHSRRPTGRPRNPEGGLAAANNSSSSSASTRNFCTHSRALILSSQVAGLSQRPAGIDPRDSSYLLELRLVHHYARSVWHCMPDCHGPSNRDMWEVRIPQMAFEHRMVLEPMLAMSALHLHSQCPGDSAMSLTMSRYLDKTLAKSLDALSQGVELNEPVFLSAVLIITMSWILAHRRQPGEKYRLPLQAYHMIRGMGRLAYKKIALLTDLGYRWYVKEGLKQPINQVQSDSCHQFREIQEEVNDLIRKFGVDEMSEDAQTAYKDSAAYLLWLYRAYFSGARDRCVRHYVATMPLRCHTDFLDLLEREDPLAMALLARSFALLTAISPAWWILGSGEYEVLYRDINGITELMPETLRWAMAWPLKVLAGDVTITRRAQRGDGHPPIRATFTFSDLGKTIF